MSDRPRFPPYLALFISIVAVSTASILIRMSSASPLAIAAYRMIFATLLLTPFFIRSGGEGRKTLYDKRTMLGLVGIGIVLSVHFAAWITSLSFTSVASSAIFVHVDPIFVAVVSHFALGERVTGRMIAGIATAFLGATVIALGDIGMGESNLYGDALALVGAVMLGIYIMAGRRVRQNLDLYSYVVPVYATSAVALTLGCLLTGTPLLSYPPREFILFLAIAVVPMILGHTMYNWALRYVKATVVSISLLGEPVGATLLAALILLEVPGPLTVFGGFATLLGIYLCATKKIR